MINIRAEVVNESKDKRSVEVECKGHIKGNGGDIRREMVCVLHCFDEVADGAVLCDAFGEFLEEKMEKRKGDGSNE